MKVTKIKISNILGLENLDERNYQLFKEAALKSDIQFVVTRVSNDPLLIKSAEA